MPDWFYRTVAQPTLFALPKNTGRTLALGVIGTLGKSRPGRAIIEFMGHMTPNPAPATTVDGMRFASPIGLGWQVDPERRASRAFAEFGIGFIEWRDGEFTDVRRDRDALVATGPVPHAPLPEPDLPVPILRRHARPDGSETLRLPSGKTLPVVDWDTPVTAEFTDGLVLRCGRDGRITAAMPPMLPDTVATWRKAHPGSILIVAGGVAGPEDALALRNAGADLILVDAGFVFSGPGLIKRCNEALVAKPAGRPHRGSLREHSIEASTTTQAGDVFPETVSPGHGGFGDTALPQGAALPHESLFRTDSFWGRLLGASLTLGGLATLALAYTRVLLPYDEHYLGTTAELIALTQPKLFDFMAHDRATLGGVMCGLGLFFFFLSNGPMRRGVHGARTVFIAACLIGFATFFSFFGFGYFDALHAFVSLLLLQMTIQVMVAPGTQPDRKPQPVDTEDATWRRAQWGRLMWVVHAVGLLIAGATILIIGMTSVFVREDVDFLCITPERLVEIGEKFTAVIAHDRATTGGMLLSSGTAMLLATLWLYRRDESWLWHAILWLGIPAYLGTLLVHFQIGYIDRMHLAPAFVGLALWAGGLVLSRRYLCRR